MSGLRYFEYFTANRPNATKHDKEHGKWYNQVNKVVASETMRGKHIPRTNIIADDVILQITALKQ